MDASHEKGTVVGLNSRYRLNIRVRDDASTERANRKESISGRGGRYPHARGKGDTRTRVVRQERTDSSRECERDGRYSEGLCATAYAR